VEKKFIGAKNAIEYAIKAKPAACEHLFFSSRHQSPRGIDVMKALISSAHSAFDEECIRACARDRLVSGFQSRCAASTMTNVALRAAGTRFVNANTVFFTCL
jgi:hypothetical protein